MKLNEIYRSKYFPSLDNAIKDELTYQTIKSPDFKTDVSKQVAVIKTLSRYGNTDEQIRDAILKYNVIGWNDPIITMEFVKRRKGSFNTSRVNDKIVWSAQSKISYVRPIVFSDALHYIDYFCQYFGVAPESIPEDPREAALYHISRGRIALPKHKEGKFVFLPHRPPGKKRMQWKNGGTDYSKLIMTEKDIYASWDWSHGVCLIVPTDWRNDCYLDIDLKSDTHKDGMEFIDEAWFKGFHYEKTKSGGYHIFGKGRPQQPPAGMGLQLVSTLIVTYPSPGYEHRQA